MIIFRSSENKTLLNLEHNNMATIKPGKRRSSTTLKNNKCRVVAKGPIANHLQSSTTVDNTITTGVGGVLPPVHSLLSLDSSKRSSNFQQSVVDTFLNYSSAAGNNFLTSSGESAFTTTGSNFNYRDFYPSSTQKWDSGNMIGVALNQPYSTVSHQQVEPTNDGQTVFSTTDEFFFTAQQMAAHLFDQYNNNSTYSGTADLPVNQDCAFYQQQQKQLPTSGIAFSTDDQVSSMFFPSNGAAVESNAFHQTALQWPDLPLIANGHTNSSNSTGDSSFNSDKSPSVVPTKAGTASLPDSTDLVMPVSNGFERQMVFMLPPPVNYRKRNERERERVRCVNDGYSRLREIIPSLRSRQKRISKVETLRAASRYIRSLQEALGMAPNRKK